MYSFSQNFEDVYIYRAFRDIESGFYIDAGAFDPVVDSVTKMLYDLGWSGINLEPGPSFTKFSARIRDINLPYALTSHDGEIDFHYNESDPGTSTTAASNLPVKSASVQKYKVRATTLETLVRDHAVGRHIHFLKLDVEGAEWEILQSTDWKTVRPELIIAESSLPYTNVRRDDGWASHMNTFGFEEVFFDGINTYYLREESIYRREAFMFPVNVLDGISKFDPYQHYALNESENSALIKNISQAVSQVVDEGQSAVREFIDNDLAPSLQVQKDLMTKLTSERSEQFSRLREIANELSDAGSDRLATARRSRGGNSIEAVIEELADGLANLVKQRDRQAADLVLANQTAADAKAALEEQERRANEARAEVRLLGKRLANARASRTRMLELTERVAAALTETGPEPAESRLGIGHERQTVSSSAAGQRAAPDPLAERIASARAVPAWRRMVRFGNRALVRRADSHRDSGRFAEAAEAYARSYALRPDRVDLALQMANMLTHLRAFALAEEAYREALAKAPNDGLILLHFGHMLEISGRPAEAQRAYADSAKHIPDHPDLVGGLNRVQTSAQNP
jgi:FkbM family methyltransferase